MELCRRSIGGRSSCFGSRGSRHSEGAMAKLDCTRAHGSVVKGPSELQPEERDGTERGECVRRGEERRES